MEAGFRDANTEESEPGTPRESGLQRRGQGDPSREEDAGEGGRVRRRRKAPERSQSPRRRKSPAEEKREEKATASEKEVPKRKERRVEREPPRREGERRRKETVEEPDTSSIDQESECSTVIDEAGLEEGLEGFRKWMKDNVPDGLGVSQLGAHLVLQLKNAPTSLGRFMTRMLAEPSSVGGGGERQRSILPLPVLPDSREAVRKIIEEKEYRRLAGATKEKRDLGGSEVHRAMRRIGLLAWHFLITLALNFLWSGCRGRGKVCSRGPTRAQKLCQGRLWEAAKLFVDDTSETKEKFVKAPDSSSWKEKLDGVKLSYQGEIVEKAQQLTLKQIMPGLPPPGYGGRVKLVDLCEGETKELLMNPLKALLTGDELPEVLPNPRVLASPEEWELIAGELYKRGLVRIIDKPASLDGRMIVNGSPSTPRASRRCGDEDLS